MELKCRIKNKEYKLVQGNTFEDEYNEKLDSGSIIISQVSKITDLMPTDDVYIYDGVFTGYENTGEEEVNINYVNEGRTFKISSYIEKIIDVETAVIQHIKAYSINTVPGSSSTQRKNYDLRIYKEGERFRIETLPTSPNGLPPIYLNKQGDWYVGEYTSTLVPDMIFFRIQLCKMSYIVSPSQLPTFFKHFLVYQFSEEIINLEEKIYKYKIELCSETKGLELVQLPNISITQAKKESNKKSVYYYINQFVQLYSPVEKVINDDVQKTWVFKRKYSVDSSLASIFGKVYAPDFSLNNPSLRDVLSQLFLTKDMIPYVKNDVIYGLDITERKNTFDLNVGSISNINGSRSIDNHCDNLKRTYSNALSQDNSARMVEFLGFRNSSQSLLTIGNMRIETKYPIYKINKIYLCYYKKGKVLKQGQDAGSKMFLCKQDITPLVMLNAERNLLSQDWTDFNPDPSVKPTTIEELAKYKLCTIGYDIGSNIIGGWGTKYTYPKGWFDVTKTYIENIATILDWNYPYGIYDYGYVTKLGNLKDGEIFQTDGTLQQNLINPFSNNSLAMKSFFFIVDYQAFYNGTVLHSKDEGKDRSTINDNSSSSLTLLEQDGLFQKEKVNRFGNKAFTINARYNDISQMQELGSVLNYDNETDIIIYHREYCIYENYVNVVYYGTKDYVLKNYFTSVYAKHRPFNLIPYGESTRRSENKKMMILLSKDKSYYENQNIKFDFINFNNNNPLPIIFSAFKPSPKAETINYIDYPDKINCGYVKYSNNTYMCDVNAFVSGYSLCFNLTMFDNVSMGVYVKVKEPDMKPITGDVTDDYTGSLQDWYKVIDNDETGFTNQLGFYVSHIDQKELFRDGVYDLDESYIKNDVYNRLFKLPYIEKTENERNIIGDTYVVDKDNKELIDMTFQIEPITKDNDVMFSQWLMKLSDLLSIHNKVEEEYISTDVKQYGLKATLISTELITKGSIGQGGHEYPYIALKILAKDLSKFKNGMSVNAVVDFYKDGDPSTPHNVSGGYAWNYKLVFNRLKSITQDEVVLSATQVLDLDRAWLGTGSDIYTDNVEIVLKKQNLFGSNDTTNNGEFLYFSNMEVTKFHSTESPTIEYLDAHYLNDMITYTNNNGNKIKLPEDRFEYLWNGKRIGVNEPLNMDNARFNEIYLSDETESKSKTYPQNMFIVESKTVLNKTLVYNDIKKAELNPSTKKVEEIFTIKTDNFGISYINVDLSQVANDINSIQYWYDSENGCKFVFGVNINETDRIKKHIRINLSLLSTKDEDVYNKDHQVIGKINNYADLGNDKAYGENQYYCDIIK